MESSRIPACLKEEEEVEITKQSSLLALINRPMSLRSFGTVSGFSSPRSRSGRSLYFEEAHFLEVCSLCQKHLGANSDIFMYRGDTPFCSEDCRQEQIDIDEAKEKNLNMSFTMKAALRKKEQKQKSSSSSQDYSNYRTGTLAAA